MVKRIHTVKINLPGGIVSAGVFYAIIIEAEKARIADLRFGTRQQLYAHVTESNLHTFTEGLKQHNTLFEVDEDEFPNIVSSYVAEEVFQNAGWLSEGLYNEVLDLFDYSPQLKINIIDGSQTFIPFFTGNINFIASNTGNYWYLYIRFPKTSIIYRWKDLIYSRDIPRVSRLIENRILQNREMFCDKPAIEGGILYSMIQAVEHLITQPVREVLKVPDFWLSYYEGFNRYGNKLWLGIYRRDELFPVSFLKDVCTICLQTKTGQLYTTPWKSLIIKGIDQKDIKLWEYMLGKYRINVRHASNELNWQVADLCEDALNLKRYLIRKFDKDDVRTFGLCFAIRTKPKTGLFGSVIIQRKINQTASKRRILDRYDILYTSNFNPNSKDYVLFRRDLAKEDLGTYLISLCKYFYEVQSKEEWILHEAYRHEPLNKNKELKPAAVTYQCSHCFTMYDKAYGDELNDIPAGVEFKDLNENYECPTCNSPKQDFKVTECMISQE